MARKGYRLCPGCNRNRQEKFFTGNRKDSTCTTCQSGNRKRTAKNLRLQNTYGITLEEYERILEAQGGGCAICGGSRSTFDVDHDHAIERALLDMGVAPLEARRRSVRGLLCKRENRRLLPAAQDNTDRLNRAIEYLDNWPADQVLGRNDDS